MGFLIADTFTDSLARLEAQDQRNAKTTAFDLQVDASTPGLSFHRVDKARDPNFWSVRVNQDIRIIVHKTDRSLMLCYVDHHDPAYRWAERRKLETHPKTGAAQLVLVRETVTEITIPKYVEVETPVPPKALLFGNSTRDEILSCGVPEEWVDDVLVANEDTLLDLAEHLPGEAAEALLDLAVGKTPTMPPPVAPVDPFEHPDAKRRFRVMNNVEELQRALDYPWEKWTIFLHPAQEEIVSKSFSGPTRISGSAGTGKTIVAIHRAAYLARSNPAVANLAELGIGTNEAAKDTANILEGEKILGTCHIAFGDNKGFGGTVSAPFHRDYIVPSPKLEFLFGDGSPPLILLNGGRWQN